MQSRKNLILILASVATFVEALDIAIINLTIPSIQSQFAVSEDVVQWLQTLYVLFFGGFLIIGGKLSDKVGRKKIFLWGGLLFMLTSLGAGLATNFQMLAFFRAMQGLGAALIMPSAFSIVTNTFRESQERSRALGIFSSFAAIGSGGGLAIGGLLNTYLSWHWVFLINVPILFVTIVLAYLYLPADEKVEQKEKTDTLSAWLMVVGLLALIYGTHELLHIQEQPVVVIGTLVVAFVLLTMLYRRLKTVAEPLIDLRLFKHKSLVVSSLGFFSLGAFFIGFLFLISLMLQKDMSYEAAEAGLMLVPFSIMSALVAKFVLPLIAKRLAPVQMGIFGWSFMLAGALALFMAVMFDHALPFVLLGAACISGIGMTFCFTSMSGLGVRDMKPSDYGVASSITSVTYFMGAGICLSFMTFFSQLVPSAFAVGGLSLILLMLYAVAGIVIVSSLLSSDKVAKTADTNA